MEVGLDPGDFMLDGDPAPLPKKGAEPPLQFSAHVHCGQTAGWTKVALGTEVGQHCARWGPNSPPEKWGCSPLPDFQPISIVAKRLDASRCHLVWRYASAQETLY